MSGHLPPEVLFNIFLKLPLKTLILCTCVSKSWQSIISDPIFISAHLNRTTTSDKKRLLVRRSDCTGRSKKELYSLHFDTGTFDLYQELEFPRFRWNGICKLVGVCNGLACLSCPNILLWNPSIRRFVDIPRVSDLITIYGNPYNYALGFGFDSRSNDFKVVRLLYFEEKTPLFNRRRPPKVELYELSTGSWRAISSKAPRCEIARLEWTQAFVNGAVHWVAFRENVRNCSYSCFILRFHIIEECFSVIALPDCLANCSPYNLKVGVLGGTLSIIHSVCYCLETYVTSVWMLGKYEEPESWSKVIRFHPSQGFGMFLGVMENGEMLMTSRRAVVLYNRENQLVKGLGIYGAEDSFYLESFSESLALLNEGKGIMEEEAEVDLAL